MPGLQAAHRGYSYQDLLCAIRLVDLVLGTLRAVWVDQKLVVDDRFDDLTTVDVTLSHARTQVKHSDDAKPLTVDTFTNDKRGLQLDRLVAAAVAYRDGPGSSAAGISFRVVLRDLMPDDEQLTGVLKAASPDPGPFVPGTATVRLQFDVDRLWPTGVGAPKRFEFLQSHKEKKVSRLDLAWLCERLVIEVEAPEMSGDIASPATAELALLNRLAAEVGAGVYPNSDRTAFDVAGWFTAYARQAREGSVVPAVDGLLGLARLRTDFGAVAVVHPIDQTTAIDRPAALQAVLTAASQAASDAVPLVVLGPPGHGKSWLSQQVLRGLLDEGWLAAEHYCYLADTSDERQLRVRTETVFGSLLGRLADQDGRVVSGRLPRLAADDIALQDALGEAVRLEPTRRVALIVDGLDHVSRVRESAPAASDPSWSLAGSLADLQLPHGTVMIVFSQRGEHLVPLMDAGAVVVEMPDLTDSELRNLAIAQKIVGATSPNPIDSELEAGFLAALGERSRGNALYATYLCREIAQRPDVLADPINCLHRLPAFDGTLESYYDFLMSSLGDGTPVADLVGLLDFPVTRQELAEIRQDLAHRIADSLAVLAPVLSERSSQGGVRVYHESFARYLRRQFVGHPAALAANLRYVTDWLENRGLFDDHRAFRYLLPALAAAERHADVLGRVEVNFAARAVAAGHPASAIISNLRCAAASATQLKDLPALVRCIELARAAETFEDERADGALADYADVPMSLLGGQRFADGFLFDGRVAVHPRVGIQLCAAADALGALAPWAEYLAAYAAWSANDSTQYGSDSAWAITLAVFRGSLRRLGDSTDPEPQQLRVARDYLSGRNGADAGDLIAVVAEVVGLSAAMALVADLDDPAEAALRIAEVCDAAADEAVLATCISTVTAHASSLIPGSVHRALDIGADPNAMARHRLSAGADGLRTLTEIVAQPQSPTSEAMGAWVDACALYAQCEPEALAGVNDLLDGTFWYRGWLRFIVKLSAAEAALPEQRSSAAVEALKELTADLHRYAGTPRAVDLYAIEGHIAASVSRALGLLDDHDWPAGLAIMQTVLDGVGGLMQGHDWSPLSLSTALGIAVQFGISDDRRPATMAMLVRTLQEGGGRHYSTLAEFRLIAARFALACGDREAAQRHWMHASELMTAYGYRRDLTIYGLLDPLPALLTARPAAGRVRLSQAQAVCRRVIRHTDGKDTSACLSTWWKTLAEADPAALTQLVVPELLATSGTPNEILTDAIEDLWRAHQGKCDAVVAAAVRLALSTSIEPIDPQLVERLAESGTGVSARLLPLLLARADERPRTSPEEAARNTTNEQFAIVESLNAVASAWGQPNVLMDPWEKPAAETSLRAPDHHTQSDDDNGTNEFGVDARGLALAIKTWRRRPYGATEATWSAQRFAAIFADRLAAVANSGLPTDAESALHVLAGSVVSFDRTNILALTGEALADMGNTRLSAIAFALAWTRSRGNGGYMTFGGRTGIDWLKRSTDLDPDATFDAVAAEVERVVAGSHQGNRGVSQALIHALLATGIHAGHPAPDTAIAAWDEAYAVIATRTPAMDRDDEPGLKYVPQDDADSEPIDIVLVHGLIGLLSRPGQEELRRSYLGLQLLIDWRPAQTATAVARALGHFIEPGTLSWLLAIVAVSEPNSMKTITAVCIDDLKELASASHLTVRSLAAALSDVVTPPPAAEPDPHLLAEPSSLVALSSSEVGQKALSLAAGFAGNRIRNAFEILPTLGHALAERIVQAQKDNTFKELDQEASALSDYQNKRWADAYAGRARFIEGTLQHLAAGGHSTTWAQEYDPRDWEIALAQRLINDPIWPISIEATRQPRPELPAPLPQTHEAWRSAASLDGSDDLFLELERSPGSTCQIVSEGRFTGWRMIATAEVRAILPAFGQERDLHSSWRYRAVEVTPDPHDTHVLPPVDVDTVGLWRVWAEPGAESPDNLALPVDLGAWRVAAVTTERELGEDQELMDVQVGLGVPTPILSPTLDLITLLALEPDETSGEIVMRRGGEPALALITWRSDYYRVGRILPWPQLAGSALLLSPEAFDLLLDATAEKLIMRDVVHSDVPLPANTPPTGPSVTDR